MKLLRFHKRTSDLSLAPLFNVYLQRLRGLYEGGVRFLNKTEVRRYWRADLRISQEDLTVELMPRDAAGFEFWTTGKPIYTGTVTQEGLSLTSIKAACVSVSITLDRGALAWTSRISKRSTDGTTLSLINRPFQVQLIDEPVEYAPPATVYGRPKYTKVLFESWAPGTSHSGLFTTLATQGRQTSNIPAALGDYLNTQGAIWGVRGSAGTNLTRDVQYDMPWASSTNGKPITYSLLNSETPSLTPAASVAVDWPRASGIRTVTDATNGTREFAVYIDSFNQVSVMPTGHNLAPNGVNQTVDQTFVKTVAMSLPGWVYVPATRLKTHWAGSGTTGLGEFPEYDWKVHPLGTKCCAVVYAKQDIARDDTFLTTSAAKGVANTFYSTYAGMAKRAQGSNGGTMRVYAPGLIEIGIGITLTGPNPQDFTLTLTTTTLRDPASHDMCTLFAGYLNQDIAGAGSRGDMVVWDVERYYRVPTVDELPSIWWGAGSTVSLEEKQRAVAVYDHERFPGMSKAYENISAVPHTYNAATPGVLTGVDATTLAPYGNDYRRTLYSLKNLTTVKELRTFPGCPSGVAQGYYIPPTDAAHGITLLGTNTNAAQNGYLFQRSGPPNDQIFQTSITPPVATPPYVLEGPFNVGLSYVGGMIAVPMHSRSQFLKVDMSTLSFVMKFQVGTQDWRRDINAAHTTNTSAPWHVYHPAVAVFSFNTLREEMFPSTLPDAYTQPSAYYTEPVPTTAKHRLRALIETDFRATYMSSKTWTLMGLGANPPGETVNDWSSQNMAVLRYWALNNEGATNASLSPIIPTSYPIINHPDVTLANWFMALAVFGRPVSHTFTDTPKFHWAMYSDLVVNSVMFNPMTCFFVHPNGTYAYFDQTNFYNPNGLPKLSSSSNGVDYQTTAGSSGGWDVTKIEHWIIDRVHFAFTVAGNTYTKDTSFREIYNLAVGGLLPPPVTEPFQTINTADLQATITKLGNGSNSPYGTSLQAAWGGHNYAFNEDSLPYGAGFFGDGNTGTMDLSLDYIFGGVIPPLADTHITFSSCLLIEASNV